MAADFCDRWLGELFEGVDGFGLEMLRRGVFIIGDGAEVVSGAKTPTGTGDDHASDSVVFGNGVKMITEFDEYGGVQGIELVGPVESQGRYPIRIVSKH